MSEATTKNTQLDTLAQTAGKPGKKAAKKMEAAADGDGKKAERKKLSKMYPSRKEARANIPAGYTEETARVDHVGDGEARQYFWVEKQVKAEKPISPLFETEIEARGWDVPAEYGQQMKLVEVTLGDESRFVWCFGHGQAGLAMFKEFGGTTKNLTSGKKKKDPNKVLKETGKGLEQLSHMLDEGTVDPTQLPEPLRKLLAKMNNFTQAKTVTANEAHKG